MNFKISKKDLRSLIVYFLLLLPFFGPRGTTIISVKIDNVIFKAVPLVISIFLMIHLIKNKKIQKVNIYVIIFLGCIGLTTYLNGGDIISLIEIAGKTLGLCLMINYAMKDNPKYFLKSFGLLLKILLIINFITIILYPNGMYVSDTDFLGNWFLGYRNVHILFIFPAIIIDVINSFISKNKMELKNILFIVFCIVSLIMAGSATSSFGVICLLIVIILLNNDKSKIKVNSSLLLIIYICLFLSIVIFRLQNLFEFLIVDVLHRDLTLTDRVFIWDCVIEYIKYKPLFGYGYEYKSMRLLKTTPISYHAHNQILEIIYQSGFLGLLCISLIVYEGIKTLDKYKDEKLSKFLLLSLIILLTMMLTEAYAYNTFIYIFVLCSNYKYIKEILKEN